MKTINEKKRWLGLVLFLTCISITMDVEASRIWTTDGGDRPIAVQAIRYRKQDNSYLIKINNTEMPIAKDRITKLEIDKPPKFDQAVQFIKNGTPDQAIPILEDIAIEYFMLTPWDVQALDMLGYVYTKKEDYKKAVYTYGKLFANAPAALITGEMQRRYWTALGATDDKTTLSKELDNAIMKGTRENAAAAHMVRADMAKKQGNKADALTDYLRVVLLYDTVKSVQAEALFKTVQCLEELKDPRAEEWKKKLQQNWPQSEWTLKLR